MHKLSDRREHLYDLLKTFDTAMLTTCSGNGRVHARPMAVAEMHANADAYLVTNIDSPKVAEIKANPAITLTFQSRNRFITVSGHARVVRDQALVDRLWKEVWQLWFPQGRTDPAIALIKFSAGEAEYWDNAGAQGLKFVYAAAKAYAKGETLQPDEKQHAILGL